MSNSSRVILWLGLILILIFINLHPLNAFFSQDDFYHLRQVAYRPFTDLPQLLLPKYSIEETFYRPLSREIYNFLMFKLFNFSALPFHLVNLFLIILNGFLSYKLISRLADKKAALFGFILYSVSAVHSIELYYLSSVQTLISTFFVLLAITNYDNFILSQSKKNFFWALIFFILSLLSHESAAVFIPLAFLLEYLFLGRRSFKLISKIAFNLLPFIVVLTIIIAIHFILVGLPQQSVYKPVFYPSSIINSFIWFTLWCLGLPEMLVDFMTLKFFLNLNFIKWYGWYFYSVFPTILIILFSLVVTFILKRRQILARKLLFLLLAFLITLLPFVFFPQHKFVYYLSLPLIFFTSSLGYILSQLWQKGLYPKLLCLSLITGLLFISFQTIKINSITHWAAKRAQAASDIILETKHLYPNITKGSIIYIKNDPSYPKISQDWGGSSRQASYILSGSDAFKLIYADPTIKVYFEDLDDISKTNSQNLIVLTPHFRY